MSNKVACLDADIIIKTCQIDLKLFDYLINYFDEIILHKSVYNEIIWPKKTIVKLNSFIKNGNIILLSNEDLYEKIRYKNYFLNSLKQACDIFAVEYEEIYSDLEDIDNTDEFFQAMKEFDSKVESNLGEIKTLQMIILLKDNKARGIEFFISEDRRARNVIITKYGSSILGQSLQGVSLLSLFYFFKKNGMTQMEATSYFRKASFKESKIYNKDLNMVKLDNIDIIDKLYDNKLKLLKTGDFKLM